MSKWKYGTGGVFPTKGAPADEKPIDQDQSTNYGILNRDDSTCGPGDLTGFYEPAVTKDKTGKG